MNIDCMNKNVLLSYQGFSRCIEQRKLVHIYTIGKDSEIET